MNSTQKLIFFTTSSLLILSLHFFQFADAEKCSPSACGAIRNITSPFRLKGDPSHCGDPEFELTCENNASFLYLDSIKYYVKAIDYQNSTIRLVDASINNHDICSFPIRSSHPIHFIARSPSFYVPSPITDLSVNLISCPNPVKNTSLFKDITQDCASKLSHPIFSYVYVGHIMASEVPHTCGVDVIVKTSWPGTMDVKNVSLSQIHQSLLYGFELGFCYSIHCYIKSTIWG